MSSIILEYTGILQNQDLKKLPWNRTAFQNAVLFFGRKYAYKPILHLFRHYFNWHLLFSLLEGILKTQYRNIAIPRVDENKSSLG
jgi:hypothetical protein